jgi:ADP-ribose pyrophosphatase
MAPKIKNRVDAYVGKVFKVRTDLIQFEDGRQQAFDVIEHPGSVTIIPVDDEGKVWLIRQYRHPAGTSLLEFPAGTLEAEEEPEQCAQRECQEEVGMLPGELLFLGSYYLAPGYSSERTFLYLARDLQAQALKPDDDEAIEVEIYDVEEIYELIASEEIQDAKTLAGLLLALPLLDDSDMDFVEP